MQKVTFKLFATASDKVFFNLVAADLKKACLKMNLNKKITSVSDTLATIYQAFRL